MAMLFPDVRMYVVCVVYMGMLLRMTRSSKTSSYTAEPKKKKKKVTYSFKKFQAEKSLSPIFSFDQEEKLLSLVSMRYSSDDDMRWSYEMGLSCVKSDSNDNR